MKIIELINKYWKFDENQQHTSTWHDKQFLLNKLEEIDVFHDLCERHRKIMEDKNIIVSVYTNASGFLWSICKVDSGTDLGWCDHHGNDEMSGTFKSYNDALSDAVSLIEKCDLEKFRKEVKSGFHWGNYAEHLNCKYR